MNEAIDGVIRVREFLDRPVLISRESARTLAGPLATAAQTEGHLNGTSAGVVVLDFAGISGVAPNFVDELIKILEEVLATGAGSRSLLVTIKNVPMRLSSKFAAIARGHHLSIAALPDGSWEMCSSAA